VGRFIIFTKSAFDKLDSIFGEQQHQGGRKGKGGKGGMACG
jgi:hypothetical protein